VASSPRSSRSYAPRLVRRIVLAATAPRGAPRIHRWSDDVYALATQDGVEPQRCIKLFFSGSRESRAKWMEFLGRISTRTLGRDDPTDLATRCTGGSDHPLGDSRSVRARAARGDHAADAGREQRQRDDDDHREQLAARAPPAERAAAAPRPRLVGDRPRQKTPCGASVPLRLPSFATESSHCLVFVTGDPDDAHSEAGRGVRLDERVRRRRVDPGHDGPHR
jgi:hypothetical protein